jgi:DNA-binding IclR family transcriptional regulator
VGSVERIDASSVLGKVDLLLGAFVDGEHEFTQAELVSRTGLTKTTVHRLLAELTARRMVERSGNQFHVGTRLFELGQLVPRQRTLREAALPFMEDLFEVTHETVNLAVLDGLEALYVEKLVGHRRFRAPTRVAGRMPLHCTALGKVLLAFSEPELLEQVIAAGLRPRTPYSIVSPRILREQVGAVVKTGVAHDREEAAVGVCCVASPVFGRGEQLIAALSVAAPTSRATTEQLAPTVRASSLALSRSLSSSM